VNGENARRPQRKLAFTDLGALRKVVLESLAEESVEIIWPHITDRGHAINDYEMYATLRDGTYEFHWESEDRYVAKHRVAGVSILVFFEIWETPAGKLVRVLTAFHVRGRRA